MFGVHVPNLAAPAVAALFFSLSLTSAQAEAGGRITRIVEAYGGVAALESVQQMESEWVGYSIGRYQSRHTDPPYDRLPIRNWSAFDFAAGRSAVDSIGAYPGELNFGIRAINDGRHSWTLNTIARIYVEGGAYSHEGLVESAANRLPWMLVREMAAHPEQFEEAGASEHRGVTYDVIRRRSSDIWVHPETSLIYAVATRSGSMADVEMDVLRTYTHYFWRDGVMVNRRHQVWHNDEIVTDLELHAVHFNRPVDAYLRIPDGFFRVPTMDGYDGDETMIRRLGDGVYLAGGGETRILYVEFDDHFVAMEAGGMPGYTEAVYNAMQPHMRGKPLRYIIPTHHHDDHAAAIHFYSRVGATILTTRDKEGFMRRLLGRSWDEHPAATNARFRFIDKPHLVLEDAANRLDIHVYSDAPHAENMLVGYVPHAELLYTCDVFVGWIGEVRQGASFSVRHLAEWLTRRQAAGEIGPIKNYGTCHGRPYSAADFGRLLAAQRTITTLPSNEPWPSSNWFERYGLSDDTIGDPRRAHVINPPAFH